MLIQVNGVKNISAMTTCLFLFLFLLKNNNICDRCNVDRLKLLRLPLPLPGDMKLIWQKIQKVIDPLHIANHKVLSPFNSCIVNSLLYVKCRDQNAGNCTHHQKLQLTTLMPTWWLVKNCLPGLDDLRKFWIVWQRITATFSCIGWLYDVTSNQRYCA